MAYVLIEYIVGYTPKTNNPFHELFYLGVPIQYVYYITCNHIQCIVLSQASFLEMHLNFHLKSTLLLSICSKKIKFEIFSWYMIKSFIGFISVESHNISLINILAMKFSFGLAISTLHSSSYEYSFNLNTRLSAWMSCFTLGGS